MSDLGVAIACEAASCFRPATDVLFQDGKVLHATCDAHRRWMRPFIQRHGRELSVPGTMLLEAIRNKIDWRLSLARKKLPDMVKDEIAWDVIDALFSPLMLRIVEHYLAEVREGQRT